MKSDRGQDGEIELRQPVAWVEIALGVLVVVAVVRMFVPIF